MDAPTKTRAALRRRVILTAGLGAALAVGSLVLPSAANAATGTAPTVAIAAPTQIVNDAKADASQVFGLSLDNSAAGSVALKNVALELSLTVPSGLDCSKITLTPEAPALALTAGPVVAGSCNYFVPLNLPIAAGTKGTLKYDVTVDGSVPATGTTPATVITGTIGSTLTLIQQTAGGTFLSNIATASGTSALVNGSAPVLAAPTAAAAVHQDYSTTVVTPGFPTATTYSVYERFIVGTTTSFEAVDPTDCATGTGPCFELNDGLVFNTNTGKITGAAADLTTTDETPNQYVIVANNKEGGATAASNASAASPALIKHDVSVAFILPVLFSDVLPGNQFAQYIYPLAGDGVGGNVISGFADGTFRPTVTVNREQFAQITAAALANAEHDGSDFGACTSGQSAFTDIPKTSPFCEAIRFLSGLGVINGETATTFGGTDLVTRGQISALISRADESFKGSSPTELVDRTCPASGSGFSDVPSTSPFCGDIAWMVANHITTGFTNGTFQPSRGAARQEAAAFLFRFETLEGVFATA